MAGFMYYLPGVSRANVSPELMRDRGIDHALRDRYAHWRVQHNVIITDCHPAPDGERGAWVYPLPNSGDMPRSTGYNAETQQWVNCGDYWLGIDSEQRPTPAELQKPELIYGYRYILGDGGEWECPVIRERMTSHHLPSKYSYDHEAKSWMTRIHQDYRNIWERSATWVNCMFGGEDYPDAQLIEDCCDLLSLNYRVHRDEVTMLELLDSATAPKIFQAAVDGPWWKECLEDPQKKRYLDSLLDSVSTSPGDEDSAKDTTPAEETCSSSD